MANHPAVGLGVDKIGEKKTNFHCFSVYLQRIPQRTTHN